MINALLNNEISQDEYLYANNMTIKQVKLPNYVYGFIYRHKSSILVAINKALCIKKKKLTLLHEFAHFELHHLDKELFEFKLEEIEDEADRYIEFLIGDD